MKIDHYYIVFIMFQLLRNQFKEYFEVNFYNPDFKYHQRELDEQILCNKRIRQNVREAREMYADLSNPWYSRKTFKPKGVSVVVVCFDSFCPSQHFQSCPVGSILNELISMLR